MKKYNKLFAILFAVLGAQVLSAQEWTDITNGDGNTFTTKYADPTDDDVFETWAGSGSGYAFDWNQTVTNIPDGVYELSANAMYRASLTYGATTNCVLYATVGDYEYTTPIANFGDYSSNENLGGIGTQINNNDAYKNKIGNIIVENGEAKIGIKSIGELAYCTNGHWFVCKKSTFAFKNVTDTYFSGLQDKINRMLASTAESDAKTALNTALTTYNEATVENIKGLQTAIAEFMKTASTVNPVDVTSYMANPSFEGTSTTYWYQDLGYTQGSNRNIKQPTGWNLMYSSAKVNNTQYQSFMPQTDGAKDGNCLYVRHRWGDVKAVEDLRQSVQELPAGRYQLVVSVKGGSSVTDANTLTLSSGSNTATTTISDFDMTNYKDYSVIVNKTADNATLDICYGLKQTSGSEQLYYIDDFRLYYLGEDLSIYKGMCDDARNGAIAARDNGDYAGITGLERTNLVNVIDQTEAVEETKNAYLAAVSLLEAATNAFVAAKANYDALTAEKKIAAGLGMSEESIVSVTATTKTGLVALQDLKVAEYNYIQDTYTESATLGSWTETFAEDLSGEGYKANGSTYFNEWGSATRTAKQTVKLTAGDYAISSIGRGQVGTSGYLYYKIGEETAKVDFIMKGNRGRGVDVDGVANFSDGGSYNCNGEGFGWEYRFITFHLDAETEVEIGVSATFSGAWVSIYAPVLLTTEASVKALRMTEIANLLSTVPTGKMNATVQATLTEKKDAAEAANQDNSIEELTAIAGDLNEAIIAANASVAEYEKIADYIAKANTIDESIAAGYQSQYENGAIAETTEIVFQNLEVATYNYVTANFTYAVALSDEWESSGENTQAADFSNEHWSGETRFYKNQDDNNGQGWNASAWSLDFAQDVTLPAGEYVFKVAGRKSEGATLQLVVTMGETTLGTVSDFPNGSTGRGINKAGAASFDPNDQFTRPENTGFGWQWRYVKFTLEEEATVKIAVHAEANQKGQWVSFGDYTLQMTEETYLEANKEGLNAALESAKELVDDDIMGSAEREALQDAIDMPVTTGAEMKAKIDALNLAVAKANDWVAAYNEAKAPLVAALERFETDYNDAENGALDHMCKSRWATAVNMAQAAAEAKDVTDSYEGFAAATENLVAALDAATVSVGEYAALKKAIDEANTLASANVGDQPFERPQSAADAMGIENAQTVYNAATADGEGVTSVTTSLNEAVTTFKAVPLNAPAEGVAYNIVLNNNNGWEYDGKAVTYMEGARNDAGLYNINYLTEPNVNYAQAFTFTAVEDQTDCYTLSMTDVDGNQRYVCTGVPYGGATGQLRTTTNDEDALVVKVIATTTDGVHNLFNTEANNYIGSQDGGFYTVNSHTNFNLVAAEKANVPLTISSAGWATLILPFNAVLPEGVKAYSCGEVAEDGETLTLVEAESIEANKPYLVSGAEGSYDFSGYGLAQQDSYTDGLFVGTYVNYTTIANSNTYVLQNGEEGVAFYRVGESAQPIVKAYRCYMTYEPEEGENAAPMFSLGRGEGTTSIDNAQLTNDKVVIYDLMGRKVTTMMKGGMYIVNGKKVVIR